MSNTTFGWLYLFSVLTGFTTKTRRHQGDTKEINVLATHLVPSCPFVPWVAYEKLRQTSTVGH